MIRNEREILNVVTSKAPKVTRARLQGSDVGFVGTKTLRPDWQVSVRANCY